MESLNSLANTNCFSILQDKLNDWKLEFEQNCAEINISRCCELLELNARIQTQLFKLLGFCGLYGGLSGTENQLRNHLIPFLGRDYLENGLTSNIVIDILNDVSQQTRMTPFHRHVKNEQPHNLNCARDRVSNYSPSCCPVNPFSDDNKRHQKPLNQGIYDRLNDLESIIIDMSNENKLSPRKAKKKKKRNAVQHTNSLPKITLDLNDGTTTEDVAESNIPGDFSGSDVEEIRNDSYLQGLVGRYNDLFSQSRIHAMDHLRSYNDDHENNQRILFALVMITAKCVVQTQRSYRNVSKQEQIQSFRKTISRSLLKSLRTQIIYELLNNRQSCYHFHMLNEISFVELEGLINDTIQLFWNFGGAKHGLNLLEAADGELFDEHKYRRSYDSNFEAPLVNHHIWPCLLQNHRVLVKGEACTRASNTMVHNNICSANSRNSSR